MFIPKARPALLALSAALLMAGCADKPTHRSTGTATRSASSSPASRTVASAQRPAAPTVHMATVTDSTRTGIPACDSYLDSYVACHRAAGIFSDEQIQSRYDQMRRSLIEDANDPDMRSQLGSRCAALSSELRNVLKGKSCDTGAGTAASSGR
ncbi:hypothetical protein [Dyella sp.]|uniref:hypothetical protein n=1 Tax=Dyella sp. TaxID=1869338 RepID=UPI002ED691D9